MATESPNVPAWFRNRANGLDAFYQNQQDKAAGIPDDDEPTFGSHTADGIAHPITEAERESVVLLSTDEGRRLSRNGDGK